MKNKEAKTLKQRTAIKCNCGYIVTGNSEDNARANLKLHLKSNKHKRLVSMNQDYSSGALVVSADNLNKRGGEN